ncbi:molybdate ABC transporter substrate-binding protein [Staphylococcus lugdunensis]|jgi:molybdate transport system substrate-binding protein|uniref:Molybdate ABC transporter substrate-binding protein n=1 Tax=Staphylococcus lugdunensis TaxID=28035 RepID=A0A133Q4S9_STALU|nr:MULTISPECIES: molybdate ABC transporter substrate-binding protein [Staphylococcus]ADC86894.1 Molybdenum ABC transporter, periplasmic molybdenum-binding protein ModA [Staphylococcus lugdunensis HKU09-01]AMG62323.1 molybdenum ABC transporter substrate-binding protein [Staphylococcus lugdunensis]AMG63753.1 molybdate ABC transporter substrate-binding protein [Staphylococcus lugdunensis]ARB77177.1 molybdate ABC transporter substrate-binding protein [Staphylococcus lugdunensis]ARJ08629.1 molybdat
MKFKHLLVVIATLVLILAGCSSGGNDKKDDKKSSSSDSKQELRISAAASLADVSKALEKEFKKDHKDAKVTFNYGGSGALRQQIEKGAPADVFMSANTKDVDALKDNVHDTYNYAHNKLVLIGDKDSTQSSVKDLKGNEKLALGEVKTVPAGKYAKQYLDDQHLYNAVKDKIVYAKDVKQVLNYVEKGNAQMGFVYKTDLYTNKQRNDKVNEIKEVELKKPITYKAGATSNSKLAKEWMDFLKSDKAKAILKDYKFSN